MVSTESRPERRRASPEQSGRAKRRRAEIVAAAVKLFSEKGFDATSVTDIAEEVGILAGSLYYHISSKEDLLFDILLDLHSFALQEMRRIDAMGGNPVTRLRRLVRNHVVNHDALRIRLFEANCNQLEQTRYARILAMRKQYHNYVVRQIRAAQMAGLCDTVLNPNAAGLALLGLVNSMPLWFKAEGRISLGLMADTIDRLIVSGLEAKLEAVIELD